MTKIQKSEDLVKRREAKSKGEKERYKHLNAEFQRIARRDIYLAANSSPSPVPWYINMLACLSD